MPRVSDEIAIYRLAPRQRLYLIGVGAIITLSQATADNLKFGLVLFGLFVVAFFAQGRFRTEVREDGIVATSALRGSKRFEWSWITEVEDSRTFGTHTVRVHTRGGKKIRLSAPIDGPMTRDDDFGAKLELIRSEWQKRRTAGA